MRVWRWEHLFSTTWVSSIESPVVFVWSLCLIASLKFVLVCYMSYMHMHLLKLLDPDTRCNPQCLSMHCGSAVFIHEQGLLNLCTCGSWAHILAKRIYTILNVHTLCCGRIIDVHHSAIFTSLQLSFSLSFEPSVFAWFEAFTEYSQSLCTLIHSSFQTLPAPQKRRNYQMCLDDKYCIYLRCKYNIPMRTNFFQLEWFMCASRTSCRWTKDIPRMLREALFSGAHKVSMISPSTCFAPGI